MQNELQKENVFITNNIRVVLYKNVQKKQINTREHTVAWEECLEPHPLQFLQWLLPPGLDAFLCRSLLTTLFGQLINVCLFVEAGYNQG